MRLQYRLAGKGIHVFSPVSFCRALSLSRPTGYLALQRYVKQGAVVRLRTGLYALAWIPLNPLVVANALCRPSYISYETAMAYYHLIPETVYAVTSATPRRSHQWEVQDHGYLFHAVKPRVFTGYANALVGGEKVLMADLEKAFCDYLHLVYLGRKSLNDRIDWKRVNRQKLRSYTALFNPRGFAKWVSRVVVG